MTPALKYQCNILVAGAWFSCIENYESVYSRLRASSFAFGGESEEGEMRYAEPLELTIGAGFDAEGEDAPVKRMVRAAIAPQAIGAVYEIPEDLQNEAP